MNPRRKKRLIVLSSVIVAVGCAVSLMLVALDQNIDLFYTPSEIVEGKQGVMPKVGQRLRIGGMVLPGTVNRDEQTLMVEFDLADIGPAVTVRYQGILPDLFREGQGIVAQGHLQSARLIVAEEVLAKHDEAYMPPELAEKMKGMHPPQYDSSDYN